MDKIDNILWQVKYEMKHNWLQARNILRTEIEANPGNAKLLTTLADLYQSKRLFRKAIAEYQKALPISPHRNAILYRIGNCFLALNEYKLAFSYYDQLQDDFPELFYNKAFALSKLNQPDEAIETLETMFSLNYSISSEMPYIFLAELHYTRLEFDKTIHYLDIAENNFGKKGSIFYLRGLTYFNLKNWLKAYIEFQNADKLKVNTAHFYKNFGLACEKIGKTNQAIDLLLKSIKMAPLDSGSYIELIKIYLGHERVIEAYTIAQHAKRNIPYSITISMLYDQILQRMNRNPEA
ncbi:MAG: tetratricopeptide repeat protein [Candidatus Cloacimonadales bacterium]|nr:tetratricopeptide repeat protein [Candidatus Cloacimonadales bacterium]